MPPKDSKAGSGFAAARAQLAATAKSSAAAKTPAKSQLKRTYDDDLDGIHNYFDLDSEGDEITVTTTARGVAVGVRAGVDLGGASEGERGVRCASLFLGGWRTRRGPSRRHRSVCLAWRVLKS